MKRLKIGFGILLGIVLLSSIVLISCKGRDTWKNGSAFEREKKGPALAFDKVWNVGMTGKVVFMDNDGVSDEKCVAILKAEEGSEVCIVESSAASDLKEELMGKSGQVKVLGKMQVVWGERALEISKFKITEGKGSGDIPGHESKGSAMEYKGSH